MEKRAIWHDKLGRLIRENNPHEGIDKTTTWCYDISGNILSRTEYAYTTGDLTGITPTATFAYTYGSNWKDQLVSFNGQSIAYDQSGNPTTYRGASLSWTRGRLLASYKASGAVASTILAYDANGIRKHKVVPGTNHSTTTEFRYSGNNLLQEKVTVGVAGQASTTYRTYLYNSQGVMGFVQGGAEYIYHKNIFGDIVAIYQGATKIAEYSYDAFGNCTIVSDTDGIGANNPFRYRGYYWDSDLNLYYLMSRYYDPQTGRFINADSLEYLDPETIGGLNLFAYCLNNPVMGIDPAGTFISVATALIILAIGTAIGIAGGVTKAIINGETGWEAVKSVFIGAAIGLMVAGFVVTIMGVFNVVGSGIAFAGKTIGFTAYRAIFEAGIQIVAIGSLAVDIPAVIIGGLTNTEWPLFKL